MTESVIGLLTDRGEAQSLRSALVEAGCAQQDVVILDRSAGEALTGELVERGLEQGRASLYAQAVQRGGILVAAQVEEGRVRRVVDAYKEYSANDAQVHEAEWRGEGPAD